MENIQHPHPASLQKKNNNIYFTGISFKIQVAAFLSTNFKCSPMARETGAQSQVESYQRLKKMVLNASLLNTQHYKVRIKGKVEKSRERSSAFSYTLV